MDRLEWVPRVALVGAPAQLIPRSYLLLLRAGLLGALPAYLSIGLLNDLPVALLIDKRTPFAVKGRKKSSFLRPRLSIYCLCAFSVGPQLTICALQRKYSITLPNTSFTPFSRLRSGEGPAS